ncbi:MAG: LysM peptidoglycan-binding domain-containing M23 family metallopeptidase [Sandaracinaceae bacterium]|nr:LysM peptidoglycan-binding domain-containing M23 family metallopeptidase [Sandaracinaceae bacterium]
MNDRRAIALATLALFATCGCEEQPEATEAPVEVAAAAPEPEEEAEPEEEVGPPPGVDHTIGEGQTLWEITRSYGVSVNDIMEANHMRPRDVRRLRAGQTLRIPGAEAVVEVADAAEPEVLPPVEDGAYHRLADGETLWDVARIYEVSLDAIMERNELDDDSVRLLRPGRALVIPGATEAQVQRVAGNREQAMAQAAPRGFRHTVARGETMWDLSGAFGVGVAEIMAANGLDEDGVRGLREGTRLWIPGVEQDAGGRVRRRHTARQERALQRARTLGLGTREVASRLLRGQVEARWIAAASRGGNRNRLPGSLRWPLANGWFVRGFGSGAGGYHLAVDVMGRIGWNVRAAAPGVVAYSGDEVPGYGNMVLLVHPGGWVTMYAHNSVNSVVAGETIPRGGILGEVGSTGISRGPHVHFELMHDGQNCDPGPLFVPGIRHRDGHLTPMPHVEWTRPSERPTQITCYRRRHHPESRWVSRESYGEDEAGDDR